MSNLNKRISNLLTKLRVDEKSVLLAKGETLDNKTIKKNSKSNSFTQEKSVTQREDMLHIIDGPMQHIHDDVVDLNFFSKPAVAPKYCLVDVDLFMSKTYTYSMKKGSHLPSKLEKLFSKTESLRKYLKKEERHQMRLQTDQEFN